MKLLDTVLRKLQENSTWRGLIFVATALGLKLDPELQNQILIAGIGLVGVINMIRSEKK